jgi:hypothetical protein
MSLEITDRTGADALDVAQLLRRWIGYGVVSGGAVTSATPPLEVDVDQTTALVDGTEQIAPADTLDLSDAVSDDGAVKVVVHLTTAGVLDWTAGTPEAPKPQGETGKKTYRPAPPDFSDFDGTPLAEVYLSTSDSEIDNSQIDDRNLSANLRAAQATLDSVVASEIIDGSGTTHTGTLADAADLYTDSDALAAVANDPGHGALSSHEYTTPAESRAAVEGNSDAADLVSTSGATGQVLESLSNNTSGWRDPRLAEAPTVEQGTFTHTVDGDGATHPIVTDVVAGEHHALEGEIEPETNLAEDYGVSTDPISTRYDSANDHTNIVFHLNWDPAPSSGTDLDLAYTVYNTQPAVVTGRFTEQDAVNAITDREILPSAVDIADALELPVYAVLSNHPGPTAGDVAFYEGEGYYGYRPSFDSGAGAWQQLGPDNSDLLLSNLVIDTSKDFGGESIQNLGAPQNSSDSARKGEVDAVASDLSAHEGDTSAHGGNYTDTDARGVLIDSRDWTDSGGLGAGKAVPVLTTGVADGERIAVYRVSFTTGQVDPAPSGLDLRIVTRDGSDSYTSREVVVAGDGTLTTGLTGRNPPVAAWSNSTGSQQTAVLIVDNGRFNTGTGVEQSYLTEGVFDVRVV